MVLSLPIFDLLVPTLTWLGSLALNTALSLDLITVLGSVSVRCERLGPTWLNPSVNKRVECIVPLLEICLVPTEHLVVVAAELLVVEVVKGWYIY